MRSIILFLCICICGGCFNKIAPILGEKAANLYSLKNEIESVPDKKGEILLNANTSADRKVLAQVNIGYSPLSRLIVSYSAAVGPLINSHAATIGYYKSKILDEKRSNKFSWHAGYSYVPKVKTYNDDFNFISSTYFKYWLQSNNEFKRGNLNYSLSFSFNLIDFQKFYIPSEIVEKFPIELVENDPFFTIESYLRLRYRQSFYGLDFGVNLLLLQEKSIPSFQRSGITTGFFLNISDLFVYLKNK